MNIINNIKFTNTEIKLLPCFSGNISKSKQIGSILGSSYKTIDTHIDNIKRKINTSSKDDIRIFVNQAPEYSKLRLIYRELFLKAEYQKSAPLISQAIKPYDIKAYVYKNYTVNDNKAYKEFIETITVLGIEVIEVKDIRNIEYSMGNKDKPIVFCLVQTPNETASFELQKQDIENCSIISFTKPQDDKNHDIVFFDKDNRQELYRRIISILMGLFPEVSDLENSHGLMDKFTYTQEDEYIFQNKNNSLTNFALDITYQHKIIIGSFAVIILVVMIFWLIKPNKYPENQHEPQQRAQEVSDTKRENEIDTLVYGLPIKGDVFTGRKQILDNLSNYYQAHPTGFAVHVLSGSAGIGKTALAMEYAYKSIQNKEYHAIIWIKAKSMDNISRSYSQIAEALNINTKNMRPSAIQKLVHNHLMDEANIGKILFILDNAKADQNLKNYLNQLPRQWPFDAKLHVLITSKNQYWSYKTTILDVYTKQEAFEFVEKQLPHESKINITNLTETLHNYPLAITQAVNYIKRHTNIEEYLKIYSSQQQKRLDSKEHDTTKYSGTLWKSIGISIDQLNSYAREILFISAYLDNDDIQTDFFKNIPIEERLEANKQLRDESLITLLSERKSFKIHSLVQEIVRLKIANKPLWLDKAIELAHNAAIGFRTKDQTTWLEAKKWLQHISTLQKHMNLSVNAADILYNYGEVAKHYGNFSLARELYYKSYVIQADVLKRRDSIGVVNILEKLGSIELALGNYEAATKNYQKSLKIKKEYYQNERHIQLAMTYSGLGEVERELGHYSAAIDYYNNALSIMQQYYQDSNDIALTDSMLGLAKVKWAISDYQGAKKDAEKALEIRVNYYKNSDNIEIYHVLNILAAIEHKLENHLEAKKIHQRNIKIVEKNYHDLNHILLSKSLLNLGISEWFLGNFKAARTLLRKSLHISKQNYDSDDHIDISYAYLGLGVIEYSLQNYNSAENFITRDYNIRQKNYQNKHHPTIGISTVYLGIAKEANGKYKEAKELIEKAYKIQHENFGDKIIEKNINDFSPSVKWHKLTETNIDQAISYYTQILPYIRKLYGANHHMTAKYHYLLGQAYEYHGDISNAHHHYKKSFEIAKSTKSIGEKIIVAKFQSNIKLVKDKLMSLHAAKSLT